MKKKITELSLKRQQHLARYSRNPKKLAQLALLSDENVLTQVALNHKTPHATLAQLCMHPSPVVRAMILFNRSMKDSDLIHILEKDSDPYVRSIAHHLE
jgi:uncharacterized protein (DUF2336 family)